MYMSTANPGCLYVVATPIGNLEDLSPRAASILAQVDLVAAEDTRRTGKLLAHLGIRKPMVSLHEHNEASRMHSLLARLAEGDSIALTSDAGTPGISDPGYRLVSGAAEQDIQVVAIPGPSAAIAALSISGLPTDRFMFYGFLPRTSNRQKRELEKLTQVEATLIFYESPYRIRETISNMRQVLGGERLAVICREITKLHEETLRGTLLALETALDERPPLKGEITLLVDGVGRRKHMAADLDEAAEGDEPEELLSADDAQEPETMDAMLERSLLAGNSVKETSATVASALSLPKRTVYQRALELSRLMREG